MPLSRAIMWIVILASLTVGVGAYWFFTREFKGQAAETVGIAHTEALTSSGLGLVGYWTLDGNDIKWSDSTTEVKDTSGNSKHGDAQGSLAAASAVRGQTGQAISFNGTSDLISAGNVYNGVKTVAFWAKPNSTTQPFIDLNATATINMTSGTIAANNFTSPTIYIDGSATSTFSDTSWHQVVVTTGTGINASAVNLGKISSSYFGGILDDIRFYSTALSATQVTDLYRASSAKEIENAAHRDVFTDGLVGYWTFDGRDIDWSDTGTEIKDISGNGNDGAVTGLSVSSVVRGKLGQALSFDGSGDIVDLTEGIYSSSSPYSITMWLKGASQGNGQCSGVDPRSVYGEGYTSGSFPTFAFGPNGAYMKVCIRTDGGNTPLETQSDTVIYDNAWHHMAWIDNVGSAVLYIDGVADTADFSYTPDTMSHLNTASIGAIRSTGGSPGNVWQEFSGSVDDVRAYNSALSGDEVLLLYNRGR